MSRKRFNFPDFIHENVDKRLQNKLKVYLPHLSRTPHSLLTTMYSRSAEDTSFSQMMKRRVVLEFTGA